MPSDVVNLSAMVQPFRSAVAEQIDRTTPGIPYAGVAIGDAADGSLLSSLYPDRTGADQLFGLVVEPHLGAGIDVSA